MNSNYEKRLIKVSELSKLYGVKQSWIRSHIFKKSFPYFKLGRLVRINVVEFEKWLEVNRVGGECE